jgi:hypothetical protein
MSQRLTYVGRKRLLVVAFALVSIFGFSGIANANDEIRFVARASGQIVSQEPCGPELTHVCQTVLIAGHATKLGAFTAVVFEDVDLATGTYTGTAVFTLKKGTVTTEYVGVVSPPDAEGNVVFTENHDIVGGTGSFEGATGKLFTLGTASATGEISIIAAGVLNK